MYLLFYGRVVESKRPISHSITNRSARQQWDTLTNAKTQILGLLDDPNLALGIRLSAMKFMQRAILVQTRGVNDPRVIYSQYMFQENNTLMLCSVHVSFRIRATRTFRYVRRTTRLFLLRRLKLRDRNLSKNAS